LRFNFSREKNKIFMGDGGSLIIGFMIAFLSLKLVVMDIEASVVHQSLLPENRLLFALAVLFIPIFDTLRVIVIRLRNGNTPFEADRNHMHHVLLDLGLNHKKASFSLGAFNLLVISCYVLGSQFLNNWGLFYLMIILIGLSAVLFNYLKKLGARKIEERDLVPGE
ncbi:MraY family glycosyltransferase, partial [uncultured Salegentibacter sp.]|uniref:MraY family glycosyltransferase n=1 Tax=uncultured Salegentibacter sp. TaxID=259320 RepID=UPI0030D954A7